MSQILENVLWALMCQKRLDMLMTIMAEEQLKGMSPQKYMMRFEDVKNIVERHVR